MWASGIGGVIASRAFIAGAQGGCQAEIGSASAMAAGGAVHLRGGSVEAVAHAAAMALKNLLGLVCDPVAGLVEVPCVKRNVSGAVVALSAADMALAGVRSRIPPDEVIDAMRGGRISMPGMSSGNRRGRSCRDGRRDLKCGIASWTEYALKKTSVYLKMHTFRRQDLL